jgi:hypothetical protein
VTSVLQLLECVGKVPAVSGAESRLYGWLLREHWHQVSRSAPAPARMELAFVGGDQLAVHWNGEPSSQRRVIITTHVDRDGYLVGPGYRDERGSLFVEGRRVRPARLGKVREGETVEVNVGADELPDSLTAELWRTDETLAGAQRDGHVVLRVPQREGGDLHTLARRISARGQVVTAHHVFGLPSTITIEKTRGATLGWGIDNAAGVAVATCVLTKLIMEEAMVNASVIYTTGEKRRFAGLLAMIEHDSVELSRSGAENLWIAIDCSDAQWSHMVGLDEWRHVRLTAGPRRRSDAILRAKPAATPKSAFIRLEDRDCCFDLSTSSFLYQAALGARAKLQAESSERKRSDAPRLLDDRSLGGAAVFWGGVCEAGVLSHLHEVLARLGHEPRGSHRVGSIALPLLSWHLGQDQPKPEEGNLGALLAAERILDETCKLHQTYWFPASMRAGYRLPPKERRNIRERSPRGRQEYVDRLIEQIADTCDDGHEFLSRWVHEVGRGLAKGIEDESRRRMLYRLDMGRRQDRKP